MCMRRDSSSTTAQHPIQSTTPSLEDKLGCSWRCLSYWIISRAKQTTGRLHLRMSIPIFVWRYRLFNNWTISSWHIYVAFLSVTDTSNYIPFRIVWTSMVWSHWVPSFLYCLQIYDSAFFWITKRMSHVSWNLLGEINVVWLLLSLWTKYLGPKAYHTNKLLFPVIYKFHLDKVSWIVVHIVPGNPDL